MLPCGHESVANPDCCMATSLWLCGNRQSIIRDRGATGSRSLSHIAEKRKGPTEQMKKAVAELLGEGAASLNGEKSRFYSSPIPGRVPHFSPLLREVGFRLKSTGRRDIQTCPQPVTCAIMVEAVTVGTSQLVAPRSPLFHGF